jgi:hypothetical protein
MITVHGDEDIRVELQNPRGWIYVARRNDGGWRWEARLGFFCLDAGVCDTEEEAFEAARKAVKRNIKE